MAVGKYQAFVQKSEIDGSEGLFAIDTETAQLYHYDLDSNPDKSGVVGWKALTHATFNKIA